LPASKTAAAAEPEPAEQPQPVTSGIIGMSGVVPSTIPTRQYSAPVGWRIGDVAPHTTYLRLDETGGETGEILTEHPGGHATQVTTGGCTVTPWARRVMDAAGYELLEG
jgi:hypothetical protein